MRRLRPVLISFLILVLLSPYVAYAEGSDDLVIGWITTQVGIQIKVSEGRRIKEEIGLKGFFDNELIYDAMDNVHIDYERMRDSVEDTYYGLTADVRANYLNLFVQYNGTGVQISNTILDGLQFAKFVNNARSYGCVTIGGGSSDGGGASRVFGGGEDDGPESTPTPIPEPSEEPTPEPVDGLDYKFESQTIYREDLYDYFLNCEFGNAELDAVYYASPGQSVVLSTINGTSYTYLYEIIIDGDTLESVYDIGTRYHLSTKYFYGFDSNNFNVQIFVNESPMFFDLSPVFRSIVLPKGYYSLAYGDSLNDYDFNYFTFTQDSMGVVSNFRSWRDINSFESSYSYTKNGQRYEIPSSGSNWDYYFGAANKSIHIKEYVIVDEAVVSTPTPMPEPDYIINQTDYEENITNNNYYSNYYIYDNDQYSTFLNEGDTYEDYVINNIVNNNYYVENTTIINNYEEIDGYVPVDDLPDEPPDDLEESKDGYFSFFFADIADALMSKFGFIGQVSDAMEVVAYGRSASTGSVSTFIAGGSSKFFGSSEEEVLDDNINDVVGVDGESPDGGIGYESYKDYNNYTIPLFEFTLPEKYGGGTYQLIDFTYFAEYRLYIFNFVRFIAWFIFFKRMFKYLPNVIYH